MKKLDKLRQHVKQCFNKLIDKVKNLKDYDVFKLGVVMLPFENFFFAPSSGWATITPVILFIYMLLNYKYV